MTTDIWYREYLSVASQLDTVTAERDKLLEKLRAYPDDPAAVMSRAFVDALGAHFQELEAYLAVAQRRADYLSKDFDRDIKLYQAELAAARERADEAEKLRVLADEVNKQLTDDLARVETMNHKLADKAATLNVDLVAARAELAAERESAESYKQSYYTAHKHLCRMRKALVKCLNAFQNPLDNLARIDAHSATITVLKETSDAP